MSLPAAVELAAKMNYAFQAQPFINIPAKVSIVLTNMEYAWEAQPFVIAFEAEVAQLGPQSGFINFQDPGIL